MDDFRERDGAALTAQWLWTGGRQPSDCLVRERRGPQFVRVRPYVRPSVRQTAMGAHLSIQSSVARSLAPSSARARAEGR